jgi:hypothetical protein
MPLSLAATVARGKAERDEGARRCAWGEKAPRHHQSTLSRGPETDDAQSAPSSGWQLFSGQLAAVGRGPAALRTYRLHPIGPTVIGGAVMYAYKDALKVLRHFGPADRAEATIAPLRKWGTIVADCGA